MFGEVIRISGPEYNAVDNLWTYINPANLVNIHRVSNRYKPFFYPVIEPVGIKGGNVGSSANTEYHGK